MCLIYVAISLIRYQRELMRVRQDSTKRTVELEQKKKKKIRLRQREAHERKPVSTNYELCYDDQA